MQYSGWTNPYASSMADEIARSGDAQAHASELIASANARAAMMKAAAWGGAVQNIAAIPGQITAARRADADDAQRRALIDQQIKNGQEMSADRKATAAREAEKRTITTIATIAKGAKDGDDFSARVGDLVQLGALRPDVGAHIAEQAKSGEWPDIQKRYVDFGAQYLDAVKTREVKTRNADGSESVQIVEDKPGQTFSSAAAPPSNEAELKWDAANPNSPTQARSTTALDLGRAPAAPPAPKGLQSENEWQVDGKSRPVIFDPATGARYLSQADVQANTPIDPSRLRKIPPASSAGPGGAAGTLDEDGLEFAATAYRLTRQLPARNAAQNGAIISRAAAQAKALGSSPAATIQKQAAYKADAGSLEKMQKMSDTAEAFEQKAIAQTGIISELSPKVGRTGSPMLNGWLLAGKDHVLGDSDTHQLFNAVATFSAEYAKIMEGSTGSAAGSSDAARRASERLISAEQGTGSMADTLKLMRREMRLTIDGYGATIGHITERMGGTPPPAAAAAPAAAPVVRDGYVRVVGPNGETGQMPAGSTLPAGWKKQ